jgi:hypothetical protein
MWRLDRKKNGKTRIDRYGQIGQLMTTWHRISKSAVDISKCLSFKDDQTDQASLIFCLSSPSLIH